MTSEQGQSKFTMFIVTKNDFVLFRTAKSSSNEAWLLQGTMVAFKEGECLDILKVKVMAAILDVQNVFKYS
jgi:hypothetical protein